MDYVAEQVAAIRATEDCPKHITLEEWLATPEGMFITGFMQFSDASFEEITSMIEDDYNDYLRYVVEINKIMVSL